MKERFIVTVSINGDELNIKTKAANKNEAIEKAKNICKFDKVINVNFIQEHKMKSKKLERSRPKKYYTSNLSYLDSFVYYPKVY